MGEIAIIERVAAVLCIGSAVIAVLTAIEQIRYCALVGSKWSATISLPALAGLILSICVIVRWMATLP